MLCIGDNSYIYIFVLTACNAHYLKFMLWKLWGLTLIFINYLHIFIAKLCFIILKL